MTRDRRHHKRIITYRSRVGDGDEVREVDYGSAAEAIHFACRDLQQERREPIEILEDGVQIYDRAAIEKECEKHEIVLPQPGDELEGPDSD